MISRHQQSDYTRQGEREARSFGFWECTLYLALWELQRTWRSYIWALALASLLGVASAFMLTASGGGVGSEAPAYQAVLNFSLLVLVAILPRTSNWHSGRQGSSVSWDAASNAHLSFLRTLPLTVQQVVAARALVSVASVLTLVAIFLAPLYALSEPLRSEFGLVEYALFAVFWVGCALVFESVGLFTELGIPGGAAFWIYLIAIWLFGGAVMGALVGSETTVVSAVAGLTQEHGAIPALAALAVGCGALTLSWLATARRIRKKEAKG